MCNYCQLFFLNVHIYQFHLRKYLILSLNCFAIAAYKIDSKLKVLETKMNNAESLLWFNKFQLLELWHSKLNDTSIQDCQLNWHAQAMPDPLSSCLVPIHLRQSLGWLPKSPTQDNRVDFLDPGFSLVHACLLQPVWGVKQYMEDLSFPLCFLSLSNK